jgi:hypothetical protein
MAQRRLLTVPRLAHAKEDLLEAFAYEVRRLYPFAPALADLARRNFRRRGRSIPDRASLLVIFGIAEESSPSSIDGRFQQSGSVMGVAVRRWVLHVGWAVFGKGGLLAKSSWAYPAGDRPAGRQVFGPFLWGVRVLSDGHGSG